MLFISNNLRQSEASKYTVVMGLQYENELLQQKLTMSEGCYKLNAGSLQKLQR
jgi:hypothetical protein